MWDWDPKKDDHIQNAVKSFLRENNMILGEEAEYHPGIDYVSVKVNGDSVLIINLPPMSDYEVEETEHTDRYLRARELVAV